MMNSSFFVCMIALTIAFTANVESFTVQPSSLALKQHVARKQQQQQPSTTSIFIDLGEPEREGITRENEPEDYFKTNTDKMSDKEKLPLALAGVAFITVPFIAGLFALYAAK